MTCDVMLELQRFCVHRGRLWLELTEVVRKIAAYFIHIKQTTNFYARQLYLGQSRPSIQFHICL